MDFLFLCTIHVIISLLNVEIFKYHINNMYNIYMNTILGAALFLKKNIHIILLLTPYNKYFDFKTFPLNALNYCTQSRAMSKKKITIQYTKVQRTNKKHQPRGDCNSLIMKKVQYQNCYTSCSAFFDLYQKKRYSL